VLNGPEGTIWVRGQQGASDAFKGTTLEKLNYKTSSTIVVEGMINWDGEFFLSSTTTYDLGPLALIWNITISDQGISAHVEGTAKWSVSIDYGSGKIGGTAKATIEADIDIEADDFGDLHLSGSIRAIGKLIGKVGNQAKELFEGSIPASVKSGGLRFRFPRGVGELNLKLL
jgi:hypothetical protein